MHLSGDHLSQVSFPVGGIGAGCIGVAGNGRLAEWEIFNQGGKFSGNGFTHFAVKAEENGVVRDVRILQGDLRAHWAGEPRGPETPVYGFGWGPDVETMAGFPHFRECELDAGFPVAEYRFRDGRFPADATLTAWSPFVPGESDLASLPVACFDITLANNTARTLDYTVAATLSPPWHNPGATVQTLRREGRTSLVFANNLPTEDVDRGEVAITTDAPAAVQESWYRGGWHDNLAVFWHDLSQPGPPPPRSYPNHESLHQPGMVAAAFTLAPGESRTVPFVVSWFIPARKNTWDPRADADMAAAGRQNRWNNYYARLCGSAADAAARILADHAAIRREVFLFRDALHSSTIPRPCLEGAAENLAVLVSPACLRLEDGTFWGWEGTGLRVGSCEGTCQHVWNYAQALALLFPDLERSIREAFAKHAFAEDGRFTFRLRLPLGAPPPPLHSCVDGAFGEVLKTFREWKISGDTAWLRRLWPAVRKIFAHAWDPANPDQWDPDQTGVISGRQHHTLDTELFGPSGWLNSHYLAALKAAAEMADACGEPGFARLCRDIHARGRKTTDETLFNGEYYIQKVDLSQQDLLLRHAGPLDSDEGPEAARQAVLKHYWSEEHRQIKYQIGEGCSIDSHLGQLYATLYGVGEVLDPAHLRSTLDAIYRHNFRSMRDIVNPWAVYAVDDEKGVLTCSWPDEAARPALPIRYHSQIMTGFEWAFAVHLVLAGMREQGEAVAAAIRDRYDGRKRNPWNEIECGSNYARAMAAYAMLQAYSGFRYDLVRGAISFHPVLPPPFQCFWSLGTAWGTFQRTADADAVRILHGAVTLHAIGLDGDGPVTLNGAPVGGACANGEWRADAPLALRAGDLVERRRAAAP